jgi:molecular chaperone GrpE
MKEDKKEGGIPSKKTQENYENQIKELQDKVESLDNSWKRALADYSNLEKRTADEKENFLTLVKIQIVESFLPFFDNLEKIQEHSKDEGLNLTLKDLQKVLKNIGVEEIEAEGKDFDHNFMEAIEVQKGEKNKVLKIIQKGYLLNGFLLRPAKVAVGQQ